MTFGTPFLATPIGVALMDSIISLPYLILTTLFIILINSMVILFWFGFYFTNSSFVIYIYFINSSNFFSCIFYYIYIYIYILCLYC